MQGQDKNRHHFWHHPGFSHCLHASSQPTFLPRSGLPPSACSSGCSSCSPSVWRQELPPLSPHTSPRPLLLILVLLPRAIKCWELPQPNLLMKVQAVSGAEWRGQSEGTVGELAKKLSCATRCSHVEMPHISGVPADLWMDNSVSLPPNAQMLVSYKKGNLGF